MRTLKLILLTLTLLSLWSATTVQQNGRWIIDANSQLLIHGQTNVNSFSCFISCYTNVDTLNFQFDKNRVMLFERNKMTVPVYNFNCGNPMITKDFRSTVKADKYPYVEIAFVSLDQNYDQDLVTGKMEITMAGVLKVVTVKLKLKARGEYLELTGFHNVCFADFGLVAPERMLGLIKVEENLKVEFNLQIRPLV